MQTSCSGVVCLPAGALGIARGDGAGSAVHWIIRTVASFIRRSQHYRIYRVAHKRLHQPYSSCLCSRFLSVCKFLAKLTFQWIFFPFSKSTW